MKHESTRNIHHRVARIRGRTRRRFEGRIISEILALSGKKCEYCYIRTKRELKALLERFASSHYRYLHLSCHGSTDSLITTLDPIPFTELGPLIKPHLRNRRLFVSACSATNRALADEIMPDSGCYSILGPDQDIYFGDAAVLWASFYHVMFAADSGAMKYKAINDLCLGSTGISRVAALSSSCSQQLVQVVKSFACEDRAKLWECPHRQEASNIS